MELDINDVEEIMVRCNDQQEYIFRGRGLEKFRNLIKKSPPLKIVKSTKKTPKIIEEVNSSESLSESEEEPVLPIKKKKEPKSVNGYNTIKLDYGGPIAGDATPGVKRALSPHDLAREMQRQAEVASGVKY